jgi:hypothetical protein
MGATKKLSVSSGGTLLGSGTGFNSGNTVTSSVFRSAKQR